MAKIEHELIPSSCSSTILTSNSTFHCIPFCLFSCSRPMAMRRSTWARCSITERTPPVQVKLIFHIMELLDFEILSMVKFLHLQGQTMTFLGLRSSMQGHNTLFLAKLAGISFNLTKSFIGRLRTFTGQLTYMGEMEPLGRLCLP